MDPKNLLHRLLRPYQGTVPGRRFAVVTWRYSFPDEGPGGANADSNSFYVRALSTEERRKVDTLNPSPNPACVVKVGAGRGFIVEQRIERPPLPRRIDTMSKATDWRTIRNVVTAAHCLPKLPQPGEAFSERSYANILGPLMSDKLTISAESVFVDRNRSSAGLPAQHSYAPRDP